MVLEIPVLQGDGRIRRPLRSRRTRLSARYQNHRGARDAEIMKNIIHDLQQNRNRLIREIRPNHNLFDHNGIRTQGH